MVIADRPLSDMVPLQKLPNKDKDKEVVSTQWDMGDVEKAGLLKMDFLGLRNLTSLDAAVQLDQKRTRASRSTCTTLPLDDEETYELLQRGETKGVFQLERAGIRDLLIKMKPDRFADIIAIQRPLPPRPAQRRHGRRVRRRASTAAKQADLPPPGDEGGPGRDLRRDGLPGTGHADPEPPGRHRALAGVRVHQGDLARRRPRSSPRAASSSSTGRDRARAWRRTRPTKIFDLIEFFGGYGFNKSHTTAYALVAYQTAYLKAHYPTEFMAALLSSEMDGAERDKFFVEHIDDCRRMGIEVLPPEHQRGRGRRSRSPPRGRSTSAWGRSRGSGSRRSRRSSRPASEGGRSRAWTTSSSGSR